MDVVLLPGGFSWLSAFTFGLYNKRSVNGDVNASPCRLPGTGSAALSARSRGTHRQGPANR